jgi:transcriptional regulator NrdR family protein
METVKNKSKVVVAILSDAIIFSRLSCKMFDILNIFDPKNQSQDFDLEINYSGMNNAIAVLKIKDDKLDNILGGIYCDLVSSKEEECRVDELATLIYNKWIKAIKKYNSSYQLTA